MKKLIGLFIVLGLSIGGGLIYVQSTTFETQALPDSYKILDNLEEDGIYQGEEIVIKNLEGQEMKLSSFKGKVVILSFWATWCAPCVEEFPSFIKLMDEFPENVVVIAISHDDEEQDVKEFVGAFKGFRENLVLTMDKEKQLSNAFGVDRLPEGFIFDQKGMLQKKIIGIQDWASPSALQFFNILTGKSAAPKPEKES